MKLQLEYIAASNAPSESNGYSGDTFLYALIQKNTLGLIKRENEKPLSQYQVADQTIEASY